jgi:NAD(P)-dependent dehydrogenase (short-subunit alcohol dehydrogenase family)
MAGLLHGGVAVVTGAGSGIGRASAIAFAREGAEGVVVADIDERGGTQTTRMVEEVGGRAVFIRCDVSSEPDVERMVQTAIESFGGLHYAHNNAGTAPRPAMLADVTVEDWDRLTAVHLKGVWLCMKHEIRHLAAHGGGAIVNTSSTAGLVGQPLLSAYSAAKHGIIGVTRTAALEYGDQGIRVNAIAPGGVETPMLADVGGATAEVQRAMGAEPAALPNPLGRMSQPIEQAEAVVWLCSDRASYLTGAVLPVDGGVSAQ